MGKAAAMIFFQSGSLVMKIKIMLTKKSKIGHIIHQFTNHFRN